MKGSYHLNHSLSLLCLDRTILLGQKLIIVTLQVCSEDLRVERGLTFDLSILFHCCLLSSFRLNDFSVPVQPFVDKSPLK